MVAGFAHEVNTPVGIAVGAASQSRELVTEFGRLLDQEEVTEEDLRSRLAVLDEIADLTLSNLRRAADMVQSFKRTAVDQVSERERDYDLAETIEDVQRSLQNAFKTTPIKFSISCPSGQVLFGPAGTLVQLLANLMQNSRMHGFADGTRAGTITLNARVNGERVVIDFADDGAGMSAEILEHAFEPFYTTRRGTGGSGLGLYIAYNLVTQGLGGTISCQSSPGCGCRFVIEFPRRTHSSEVVAS
jgi:signal transduction histidine kinase